MIPVQISSLSFLEKPSFTGNPDQFHLQFAKSIAYGIVNPIITDCKGLVIDGERRVKAALALADLDQVPCCALDDPLDLQEAVFFRVLLNPGKKASPWTQEVLGGNPFVINDQADCLTNSMIHERATETIKARTRKDMALQQLTKRYDATLLETAKHCVNAIRCLQAIGLNCKNGLTPNLAKAKELMESAIQEITSPS